MNALAICPYCHTVDSIQPLVEFSIQQRTEFPVRKAKLHQCTKCQQIVMSVFEEKDKQIDPNAWNAYYYYLPQSLQQNLLIHATLCPTPYNENCKCVGHKLMNELDFSQLQALN